MSWNTVVLVIGGVAAAFSGVFWVLAARTSVPVLHGILTPQGTNRAVRTNARIQSLYNGVAAWLAAVAAFCQCISTAITIHGPPTP